MNKSRDIVTILKEKDMEKARDMIRSNFKDKPSLYFYYLGLSYCTEGNYGTAILFFKISIREGLHNYLVYYNLGVSYLESSDYKNAERHFKKSIDLNRGFGKSYINLAFIYYKNGDIKRAYRIIKTGLVFSNSKELYEIEKSLLKMI